MADDRDAAAFYYEELALSGIGGDRWGSDDAAEVIAALAAWRASERAAIVADLRHRSATKLPGEHDVVRSLALQAAADHYERGLHLEPCEGKASHG